jgi:regulator of sigma E protease
MDGMRDDLPAILMLAPRCHRPIVPRGRRDRSEAREILDVMQSLLNGTVTIVAFLLMLGLLVLVHELGHFLTAIKLGIKVEEFGIGFPPRARVLFERNGVKYTLNWLPIGGFVRFGGEGETVYGVGSLASATPWKKIAVLLAGPLMNLFLAFIIFAALFAVKGVPADGAQIGTVYPDTPAAAAGFRANDIILELDGQPVGHHLKLIGQAAQRNPGVPITALVQRGDQRLTLRVTPGPWTTPEGEQRAIGFGFSYGQNPQIVAANVPTAIATGFESTWEVLGSFIGGLSQALGGLFGLNAAPPGGVTGIVGIARGTGEVIQRGGLPGFWQWTAFISLNLFLVNLLPIPALDGSHIMFSLIELVRRGKKIPPEKEALVHAIGFMVLMGLMLIITVSDVANWIGGAPALGG